MHNNVSTSSFATLDYVQPHTQREKWRFILLFFLFFFKLLTRCDWIKRNNSVKKCCCSNAKPSLSFVRLQWPSHWIFWLSGEPFNSISFLCVVLFWKKKENSNRNPFKIRLFVSSCICEYVKLFSAGRIQWLLFARSVYTLGMITYLAAGAFLFWMLLFEFFGSSCFHFVVVDWMFKSHRG